MKKVGIGDILLFAIMLCLSIFTGFLVHIESEHNKNRCDEKPKLSRNTISPLRLSDVPCDILIIKEAGALDR